MATLTTREPTCIDPHNLYSRRGFHCDSGISETRLREARRMGIELPTIEVGRRKFYRGSDIIEFIERLAATEGQ